MAVSSGQITTTNSSGYRNVTFSWSLQSQDVATNATVISWQIVGAQDGGDTGWYYAGPFNLTINGTQVVNNLHPSGDRIELRKGTVVTSGTATITHDSSTGAKTFSATLGAAVYDTVQHTVTGSWELPVIPRASTASVASAYNIGSSYTIAITRKNSAFYHRLSYKYGAGAEQVIAASAATSATWNLTNWGANIPAAMSASVTVYLRTYPSAADATNQTNQIGDTASYAVTLNVPAYNLATPTVAVAEANSANTTGVYVQGVSKIRYTITAVAQYGGTLSYKVTVAGQSLSGSNTLTSDTISTSGTVAATITVIDSRNKTASTTASVTVKAYHTPTISGTAVRSSDGTSITCTVTASASSILKGSTEKNSMRVYALYSTTQTYPSPSATYQVSTSGLSASGAVKTYTGLSASTTYYVRLYVEDLFGYYRFDVTVGTGGILHVTKSGIGVLKRRENGALDVDGSVFATGSIWAGTASDAVERDIGVRSSSGIAYLASVGNENGNGNRGIYMSAHGSVAGHWLIAENSSGTVSVAGKTPVYTTDEQSISGNKNFTGYLRIKNSQSYPVFSFISNDATGNPLGSIFAEGKLVNNIYVSNRIFIRSYTHNSSTGEQSSSVYENYMLPAVTADRSAVGTYDILTSKSAVTVAQGGTGATNAAGARTNLGVNQPAQLASTTVSGNSSATLSVTTANYAFYLFKFVCTGYVTQIPATYASLGTSAEKYMISDGTSSAVEVTITRTASGITVARPGSTSCTVTLYGWN